MRVALLTNFVPPYRVPLFQALAREVGELRVFVSTRMEANRYWQPGWQNLDVVEQRTFTLRRTWRTGSFSEDYQLHVPYDTVPQLGRFRPDVIISAEFGARSLQAIGYARATRKPVLIWATLADHLEDSRGRLRHQIRRGAVRLVDAFIVNGENGARYLRRLGAPDERLLRVNQPVDMSALLALPLSRLPEQQHRLLFVSQISERKGVHLLLAALEMIGRAQPERSIQLTLVGDGPLRAELQARPTAPNVELTWTGHVEYARLPEYYAAGGVLVFPTLGDEWGLVVNEALAAGLPVLGSTFSPAVEELVRPGYNGWTFTPHDVASIAAALERVLATAAADLDHMRHAARESVRQLTPDSAAARIAAKLRELVPRERAEF